MSDRLEIASVAGGFIPERLNAGGQAVVEAGLGAVGLTFVLVWLTPVTATLIHASLFHVAMNLLMLGFCGRFVEAALGVRGLITLYVIGAYAAAGAQYVAGMHSLAPMVGASGAVSALFGAYALLFGEQNGVLVKHRFGKLIHVVWLAAAWIGFQLLIGLATGLDGATIAVAAHIGGFVAGLALARPILRWRYRSA